MPENSYPFTLKPLPYAYDALEPAIDARTVEIHHDRHVQTYVDNLNRALAPYPMYHGFTLERLLKNLGALPEEIRRDVKNNAGGVYNHNLYFDSMRPLREENRPEGKLADEIDRAFGSFSAFQKALSDAAKGVFGSGWAWLVCAPEGLKIIQTKDQDTVLPYGVQPLLLIDVWEHAYYLKYQNLRADYIAAWFSLIDWDAVQRRAEECREHERK
mgnify:CR=1 FL=1